MNTLKDLDLYLLIEVQQDATEKEIKRAYRKKALKWHPDKNPDDPNAAIFFQQLQEALAVLTDSAARKAYDAVLSARNANEFRNRQVDEKRRKFKVDLEARENEAAKENCFSERRDKEKLAAEIERVRKDGIKELEEEEERIRILIAKEKQQLWSNYDVHKSSSGTVATKIKVDWKAEHEWQESEWNMYTVESLKNIFSKYGKVNVVIISGSSNARKGSALIEMASSSSAEMAKYTERGFKCIPLTIKLLVEEDQNSSENNSNNTKTAANFQSSSSQHNAVNFQDYESLVLRKMRQAEERKRLEREIIEQDKHEEETS